MQSYPHVGDGVVMWQMAGGSRPLTYRCCVNKIRYSYTSVCKPCRCRTFLETSRTLTWQQHFGCNSLLHFRAIWASWCQPRFCVQVKWSFPWGKHCSLFACRFLCAMYANDQKTIFLYHTLRFDGKCLCLNLISMSLFKTFLPLTRYVAHFGKKY